MTSIVKAPGVEDSPESCPELDDDYFDSIGKISSIFAICFSSQFQQNFRSVF